MGRWCRWGREVHRSGNIVFRRQENGRVVTGVTPGRSD